MSTIEHTIIDKNLFSGSIEHLRNHLGLYYIIGSGSDGEQAEWSDNVASVEKNSDYPDVVECNIEGSILKKISMNFALETTASSQVIFPNRRVPVRLHGDESAILSDEHWRALIYGGSWSTGSYPPIYINATFDSNVFNYKNSYPLLEAMEMAGDDHTSFITYDINYEYNAYYENYQEYIGDLIFDTLIPNAYYIQYAYNEEGVGENRHIANFITRNAAVDEADDLRVSTGSLLTPSDSILPPPYVVTSEDIVEDATGVTYLDKTLNIRSYLTGVYVEEPVFTDGTQAFVEAETVNLLFSEEAIESLFNDVETNKGLYPFYASVNINLPEKQGYNADKNTFQKYIQSADYEQLFLYSLKERFVTQESVSQHTAVQSSIYKSSSYSATDEADVLIDLENVSDITYNMIDFPGLLMEALNNPQDEKSSDCYFVGAEDLLTRIVDNPDGTFRYAHTISSIKMIENLKSFMETDESQFPVQEDFFNTDEEEIGGFLGFMRWPSFETTYTETLAYRIKKTHIVTKGVQNIFLFNCETLGDSFTYYDTQIKYDQEYSYEVYSYKVYAGYKYNFSDSVISRNIGSGEAGTDFEGWNCLQFEDTAGLPSSQLFFEFEDNPLADTNQYATNAQTISPDGYLFDFYLNIEPQIKIMEIPIASDTLTILDHPPVQIDVTPYQRMNNSQIIGFFANFESFAENTFPMPLSPSDIAISETYLASNNILSTTDIETPSVSRIRYVDIYRLSDKPSTMQDFNAGYITSKDLLIKDTDFTDTTCFYEEKIQTNTKYYYLFRFRNTQGMYGRCSRIIVAEMIDDGGYKYSSFETMTPSDLVQSSFEEVRLQFKKLINIMPNINQITFDDRDVDYTEPARAQIGNLSVGSLHDSLWGKTFQIKTNLQENRQKSRYKSYL